MGWNTRQQLEWPSSDSRAAHDEQHVTNVCPVAGSRCISATCGNGVLETPREQCDDGLNDGSYGTCGPDCFLASHKRPATTVRTTAGTAAADPTASPIRTAATA